MRECERKETLCTCVDWETGDLEKRIHHLVCNFEFTGFELEYTTLEPAEGCRLCSIGRCRICGKRLCFGDDLPAMSNPDDLLAEIFRRTFRMWADSKEHLPDGADCFTDLFLVLFHEDDRDFVRKWLDHRAGSVCPEPNGEDTK